MNKHDEEFRNSRYPGMVVIGILFGGIPGAFLIETGSFILSFILGSLLGIIFWVGLVVLADTT